MAAPRPALCHEVVMNYPRQDFERREPRRALRASRGVSRRSASPPPAHPTLDRAPQAPPRHVRKHHHDLTSIALKFKCHRCGRSALCSGQPQTKQHLNAMPTDLFLGLVTCKAEELPLVRRQSARMIEAGRFSRVARAAHCSGKTIQARRMSPASIW